MPTAYPVPINNIIVKQSEIFSSIPDDHIEQITKHLRAERWPKKTYFAPENLVKRFFIILEGRIEMTRTNPDTGRSITLDLLYPGDSLDLICLLDGKAHEADVTLLDELKVISVPIDKMREWIWTYPELNQKFMPYLAKKIRDQEDTTTDIALFDTVTRLSRILLKNLDKMKVYKGLAENEHHEHLVSGLSDELLARMAGSVRQVINQHLQHWKKQGIINKARNKIMINDLQAIKDDADLTLSRY